MKKRRDLSYRVDRRRIPAARAAAVAASATVGSDATGVGNATDAGMTEGGAGAAAVASKGACGGGVACVTADDCPPANASISGFGASMRWTCDVRTKIGCDGEDDATRVGVAGCSKLACIGRARGCGTFRIGPDAAFVAAGGVAAV